MGCTSSRNAQNGVVRGENNQLDISNGHNNHNRNIDLPQSDAEWTPPNQLIDLTTIARRYNRAHHSLNDINDFGHGHGHGHGIDGHHADNVHDRNVSMVGGIGIMDQNHSDEELRQLQADLETLERLFQSLLGQSFASQLVRNMELAQMGIGLQGTMMDNGNGNGDGNFLGILGAGSNSGCPPAAREAIDQLPQIQIQPHDLLDECNRECCICFFSHELDDTVARLPCGHLFHQACIAEWLTKKCTCPICRYEIRTDNESYEEDRIQRMRNRRIRLREHDLSRMTMQELISLADWVNSANGNGNGNENENENSEVADHRYSTNSTQTENSSGQRRRRGLGLARGRGRGQRNRNHQHGSISETVDNANGRDRESLVSSIRSASNVDMIHDPPEETEGERTRTSDERGQDDDQDQDEDHKQPATIHVPQSLSDMNSDIDIDIDIENDKHIVGTIPLSLSSPSPSPTTTTNSSSELHTQSAFTHQSQSSLRNSTDEEEKEEIPSSMHVAQPMTNARHSSVVASNRHH